MASCDYDWLFIDMEHNSMDIDVSMGYVDGYLHDGREMLREAKQRRKRLQDERRRLEIV